jgi:hypothetical protein
MTSSVAASGLCATCCYARRIGNRRGSTFIRCGRSAAEPRYARYPPLPVLHCPGYEAITSDPDTVEP